MKILVTLDGSTFSEAILPAAAQLAQATGSEIHLLSVVEDPSIRRSWVEAIAMGEAGTGEFMIPPASMPRYPDAGRGADMSTETLEEAIQSARQYLAEVALEFPAGAKSSAVPGNDPVAAIAEYAAENGIELIAMSTHGRSGIGRWVYGSNADKLLQSTSYPILLVRPRNGDAPAQGDVKVDTLLVPLDGSLLAEEALAHAEALALQMSLKLLAHPRYHHTRHRLPRHGDLRVRPRLLHPAGGRRHRIPAGEASAVGVEGPGGLLHSEGRLPRRQHNRLCGGQRGKRHSDVHARARRPGQVDTGQRGRPRAPRGLPAHPVDSLQLGT